jgi:hypothetical protein
MASCPARRPEPTRAARSSLRGRRGSSCSAASPRSGRSSGARSSPASRSGGRSPGRCSRSWWPLRWPTRGGGARWRWRSRPGWSRCGPPPGSAPAGWSRRCSTGSRAGCSRSGTCACPTRAAIRGRRSPSSCSARRCACSPACSPAGRARAAGAASRSSRSRRCSSSSSRRWSRSTRRARRSSASCSPPSAWPSCGSSGSRCDPAPALRCCSRSRWPARCRWRRSPTVPARGSTIAASPRRSLRARPCASRGTTATARSPGRASGPRWCGWRATRRRTGRSATCPSSTAARGSSARRRPPRTSIPAPTARRAGRPIRDGGRSCRSRSAGCATTRRSALGRSCPSPAARGR